MNLDRNIIKQQSDQVHSPVTGVREEYPEEMSEFLRQYWRKSFRFETVHDRFGAIEITKINSHVDFSVELKITVQIDETKVDLLFNNSSWVSALASVFEPGTDPLKHPQDTALVIECELQDYLAQIERKTGTNIKVLEITLASNVDTKFSQDGPAFRIDLKDFEAIQFWIPVQNEQSALVLARIMKAMKDKTSAAEDLAKTIEIPCQFMTSITRLTVRELSEIKVGDGFHLMAPIEKVSNVDISTHGRKIASLNYEDDEYKVSQMFFASTKRNSESEAKRPSELVNDRNARRNQRKNPQEGLTEENDGQ